MPLNSSMWNCSGSPSNICVIHEACTTFFYAYSPNSPLNADPGTYLNGYPGDDYVDIFGYDSYDETGNGQEWLRSVTADLATVVKLADAHGKVPAWTEFGPYEGTEPDPHWFTSVLGALKADQNASRIAWMLTWANYGHGDREHAYVPYPAHGDHPEHPLLADFRVFTTTPTPSSPRSGSADPSGPPRGDMSRPVRGTFCGGSGSRWHSGILSRHRFRRS